jgi:hypothetical protein
MGETCSTYEESIKNNSKFQFDSLKGRNQLRQVVLNERILLK